MKLNLICLLCLLLAATVIPSSAGRRGKKNRGSNTYYKKKQPTNVDYTPYNSRRGFQGVTCSNDVEYICGNNGVTYQNFCELMKAMCTSTCLKFAYYGRCRENGPRACARCSSSLYWPYYRYAYKVCGTDGVTYNTKCELCRQMCLTGNSELDVDYKGSCVPSQTPSKDTLPQYTTIADPTTVAMTTPCNTDCPLTVAQVCGTDGETYPNPCVLNAVRCRTDNPGLGIAYEGPCRRGDV